MKIIKNIEPNIICSICKNVFVDIDITEWSNHKGETVVLPESKEIISLVDTSVGEIYICEDCYLSLPEYFTKDDMMKIHYEFGLEYREKELFDRSLESLKKALVIKEDVNILSAMAEIYDTMGMKEKAIRLYHKVIKIDPKCTMAINNLKLLYKGLHSF